MSSLKELQEHTDKDVTKMSEQELFELKKKVDKWWVDALERCNKLNCRSNDD